MTRLENFPLVLFRLQTPLLCPTHLNSETLTEPSTLQISDLTNSQILSAPLFSPSALSLPHNGLLTFVLTSQVVSVPQGLCTGCFPTWTASVDIRVVSFLASGLCFGHSSPGKAPILSYHV